MKLMHKKSASVTLYITALFVMFLAFSAFVIDGTITFNLRQKLQNITESSALSAAENFNSENISDNDMEKAISQKAEKIFKLLSKDGFSGNTELQVIVDKYSKTVNIRAKAKAKTYFLAFLGVSTINLNAKAAAKSESLPVNNYYSGINWVTVSAAYLSDIISNDSNYRDTAILPPLGNFKSASFLYGITNYELINGNKTRALSLGPGGYITVKLPAPVVDKPGYDIYIEEIGSKEGYLIWAGIDNNPDKPYSQSNDNTQDNSDGISWVNISNIGYSKEIGAPAKSSANKFYGSGYFDISKAGLSVVKYIRIIDDNDESAFVKDNDSFYKTTLYGESSSATSGADISGITVLNHVKLINPN